jgi:hypothetical protein
VPVKVVVVPSKTIPTWTVPSGGVLSKSVGAGKELGSDAFAADCAVTFVGSNAKMP